MYVKGGPYAIYFLNNGLLNLNLNIILKYKYSVQSLRYTEFLKLHFKEITHEICAESSPNLFVFRRNNSECV